MGAYDLVLRGGHVIDPANARDGVMDVAISGGRVARVAPAIEDLDARSIDVSGRYVTPGLIDIHVHVYPHRGPNGPTWQWSIIPDAHSFRVGVTTLVDAGTAGADHFDDFRTKWIDRSQTRVLAWLNIAAGSMGDAEQDPRQFDVQRAAHTLAAHSDVLVGIKTAHYWTRDPWDDLHTPWASVDAAVEAGERSGRPIMVDFWPRPPERSYPDLILKHMRPGDVHTHVFAQQFPILTPDGGVYDYLWQARDRGVLFDLGHGGASFWFRNAVPAIEHGFPPDSISTDLHAQSILSVQSDMPNCISKMMTLGMGLQEAILRSTVNPARAIKRYPELGTLGVGSNADLAILNLESGVFAFTDAWRKKRLATKRLECVFTIRDGKIVFDMNGLAFPLWNTAGDYGVIQ